MERFARLIILVALQLAVLWMSPIAMAQAVLPMPFSLTNVGGSIWAITLQPDGKIIVGGNFAKIGGVVRHNIARLNADGSIDPDFHVDVDSYVNTIALTPTAVYIGGYFRNVAGVRRLGVAALDPATGSVLPWNPGTDPQTQIRAIAVAGDTVYLGGFFVEMGGMPRSAVAAVDANTGTTLPFDAQISAGQGAVSALAIADGTVYAGGLFFGQVGGELRNGLVALDTITGAADAWAPFGTDTPRAGAFDLAVVGSTLYVAGDFLPTSGGGLSGLAAFDLPSRTRLPWAPPIASRVNHMAFSGNDLYVAGQFYVGSGAPHFGFAKVSLADGSVGDWDAGVDGDTGRAIAADGTHVYVGGDFTHAQGVETGGFARLDQDTASLANSPHLDAGSSIEAVAYQADGKAVIGGFFGTVDGIARQNLARLLVDGSVDTDFNPGADSAVTSLLVRGTTIYAGGYFSHVGGAARSGLAAIDADTGTPTLWNPSGNAYVHIDAIAASDTALYAGGSFSTLGGAPHANLGAVDLASGVALPSWSADTDGRVSSLAVANGTLFVGGEFANAGGQSRAHLAAFDAAAGSVLAWDPGADATVRELAVHAGSVYAGGFFSEVGGQPRAGLAEIDATTGVVSAWAPSSNATRIWSLALHGDELYVGGAFTTMGGESRTDLAAFDLATHALTPWQIALDGPVFAIAPGPNSLLLGGDFSLVGGESRYGVAAVTYSVDRIFASGFEAPTARP